MYKAAKIIFDELYLISHFKDKGVQIANMYILLTSCRCITNPKPKSDASSESQFHW